ncbi:MAG: hypothetical protein ACJA1Z_002230 [Patiriisocius sp.]
MFWEYVNETEYIQSEILEGVVLKPKPAIRNPPLETPVS